MKFLEKHYKQIILILILLLGSYLRINTLTLKSLWLDEALSISFSSETLNHLLEKATGDIHPPLYYFVLFFWTKLFGLSEFATRILSVFAGVSLIYVIYKAGKSFYGVNTGLIAAFLISISAFHIKYSQEVRGYELLSLFSLLSIYYFYRFLHHQNDKISVKYIICTVIMLYLHVYGIFTLFVQFLYYYFFLNYKEEIKPPVKIFRKQFIIITILFLPWIPILLMQVLKVQKGFAYWITKPDFSTLYKTFIFHSGNNLDITAGILLIIFMMFLILAFINITKLRQRKFFVELNYVNLLLISWFIIPTMLAFITSQIINSIYDVKSTIAFSGAFVLLVSYSIAKLKNMVFITFSLLIIIILSFKNINTLNYIDSKEDWRNAAKFIKEKGKDENVVVIPGYYKRSAFDYYYGNNDGNIQTIEESKVQKDEFNIDLTTKSDKIWLMFAVYDRYNVRDKFTAEGYKIKKIYNQFNKIEIYYLEKESKDVR